MYKVNIYELINKCLKSFGDECNILLEIFDQLLVASSEVIQHVLEAGFPLTFFLHNLKSMFLDAMASLGVFNRVSEWVTN